MEQTTVKTTKTITAIILGHYKEREANLKRIVDDLMAGSVKPDKIVIFIDNPEIVFDDDRATIIRSSKSFLPNVRFALGLVCETDYCFFIDDDLTVREKTLENFAYYADPRVILGLEGSVLGKTDTPYLNDTPIKRGISGGSVDIVIRTYFVPTRLLTAGFRLRLGYPTLPKVSLDDVFLCLGNKYLHPTPKDHNVIDGPYSNNFVVPVDENSDLTELPDGGVGQSSGGDHYKNRNIVCKFLMDKYEKDE